MVSEICNIAEVIAYLGKGATLTDAQLGQLTMVKWMAENVVRQYCQYGITQQTYVHFLPEIDHLATRDTHVNYGYGGPTLSFPNLSRLGPVLQLPEAPLIDVLTVYEDENLSFAASTALTKGTHFRADELQSSFCQTAQLIRIGGSWPRKARSVKVQYVAGWTQAQLRGDVTDWRLDASDIRLATIQTIVESYNEMVQQQSGQGGSGGPIKSERLGDYSVAYDTTNVGPKVHIPEDAKLKLGRFMRADTMLL